MKQTRVRNLVSLFAVALVSLAIWSLPQDAHQNATRLLQSYQTNPTRMMISSKLCAGLNRNSLVTEQERNTNAEYTASLQSAIPIDGNLMINTVLDDNSKIQSVFMDNIQPIAMFIGGFAIGIILFMFSCPCLCCCCCCPGCCPSSCCRKDDKQQYTKCELYWPAITLMIALLMTLGSSAFGISKAQSVTKGIQSFLCSVSLIPDDLLNGNVTKDGNSYFSGISTLSTNLGYINGNLTTINNSIAKLADNCPTNTSMLNTINAGNTALTDLKKISDNVNGMSQMSAINYGGLFSTSSIFPSQLGTFTTSNTILYTAYTILSQVVAQFVTTSDNAKAFQAAISTAGFSTAITTATTQINDMITKVSDIDNSMSSYANMNGFSQYGTMSVQIIYATLIGFSTLALLGLFLMCCCQKYKCRYLMYFSCFFMSIFCIIGFFISTFFSIFIPPINWGCQYLNFAMKNQGNFDYNFRGLDATILSQIGTCMPFGTGDIISNLGGSQLSGLTNLTNTFSVINSFDATAITTLITNTMGNVLTAIDSYGLSQIQDVTDAASIAILNGIASAHTNSTFNPCLSNTNFQKDSFVPSNNQNPAYISCKSPGINANEVSCPLNSGATPLAFSATCQGCLDTARIFYKQSAANNVKNALIARYSNDANCNNFVNQMENVWMNYYLIKQTTIGNSLQFTLNPALSTAYNRAKTAEASFTTFSTLINTQISVIVNSAKTATSTIATLVDPKYGVIGGLNCKLFGEDFQTMIDTLCVNTFNSFYAHRLALGIGSWGLLFSLCCIVCSGVRHFKHGERMKTNDNNLRMKQDNEVTRQTLAAEPYRPY